MKDENNICIINATTFEIAEIENSFIVSKKLGKTISILNKKGYYTESCCKATLSKPLIISNIIHNLIEEKLIEVNEYTTEKIRKIIDMSDFESTIIIFKKNYEFKNLPNGFKLIGKDLYYNLKILKDGPNIKFKSVVELDKENEESLKSLEKWANNL